jgi:hypothetical protein
MASLNLGSSSVHRTHQAVASCAVSLPGNAPSYCHQPNWSFNADATAGHAFGILMACRGALRTSCCGAG